MSLKHGLNEQFTTQEGKNAQLGQAGYKIIDIDNAGYNFLDEGHYIAVTALNDNTKVIATIASGGIHGTDSDDMVLIPMTEGQTIYGSWSKIGVARVASGSGGSVAIIYKG